MVFFNEYFTCDCDFYKIQHFGQSLNYLMWCENTSMKIVLLNLFCSKTNGHNSSKGVLTKLPLLTKPSLNFNYWRKNTWAI
jgi:hypothetical protein